MIELNDQSVKVTAADKSGNLQTFYYYGEVASEFTATNAGYMRATISVNQKKELVDRNKTGTRYDR